MSGVIIKDYVKQSIEDYTKEQIWELKGLDMDQIYVLTEMLETFASLSQEMLNAIEDEDSREAYALLLNTHGEAFNERLQNIYDKREALPHTFIPSVEVSETAQ